MAASIGCLADLHGCCRGWPRQNGFDLVSTEQLSRHKQGRSDLSEHKYATNRPDRATSVGMAHTVCICMHTTYGYAIRSMKVLRNFVGYRLTPPYNTPIYPRMRIRMLRSKCLLKACGASNLDCLQVAHGQSAAFELSICMHAMLRLQCPHNMPLSACAPVMGLTAGFTIGAWQLPCSWSQSMSMH